MNAKDLARKLAVTALGLGYLPLCPGTWGSLGAVAAYLLLASLAPGPLIVPVLAVGTAGALALGMALCPWAERHFETKDPSPFVLDEVAGQWLTCLAFCLSPMPPWLFCLLAFLAFRLFDVVKPPPIRRLEKLPGGWGVMTDDLVAAAYAAVLLLAARRIALAL